MTERNFLSRFWHGPEPVPPALDTLDPRATLITNCGSPNHRPVKAIGYLRKSWWARQDSNLQPDGYEPSALPVELRAPQGLSYVVWVWFQIGFGIVVECRIAQTAGNLLEENTTIVELNKSVGDKIV